MRLAPIRQRPRLTRVSPRQSFTGHSRSQKTESVSRTRVVESTEATHRCSRAKELAEKCNCHPCRGARWASLRHELMIAFTPRVRAPVDGPGRLLQWNDQAGDLRERGWFNRFSNRTLVSGLIFLVTAVEWDHFGVEKGGTPQELQPRLWGQTTRD